MPNHSIFAPAIRARALPFVVFVLLTGCQDLFGGESRYWFYLVKTLVGLGCLLAFKAQISELQANDSSSRGAESLGRGWKPIVLAIGAGVFVFVVWVVLDNYDPKPGKMGTSWNPLQTFRSPLGWFFITVRILGSSLVVPFIEEVFYRSFLYRYIIQADFTAVPLSRFDKRAFLITALVFGFAHFPQWLAGVICGLIYQGLVMRQGRLREAIIAHAITNFLLGLWVVWKGAWEFW